MPTNAAPLTCLVTGANAGIVETTWATNYLGPALLTELLPPHPKRSRTYGWLALDDAPGTSTGGDWDGDGDGVGMPVPPPPRNAAQRARRGRAHQGTSSRAQPPAPCVTDDETVRLNDR